MNATTGLEARIAQLEDYIAIQRVIAAYGPAVDTLDAGAVAALWSADGSYDWGDGPLTGADDVGALVDGAQHRAWVMNGAAHIPGLPLVQVTEDTAEAVSYSQVCLHEAGAWRIARCSANHWQLKREAGGWKVVSRENRPLNGDPAARDLLSRLTAQGGAT